MVRLNDAIVELLRERGLMPEDLNVTALEIQIRPGMIRPTIKYETVPLKDDPCMNKMTSE